MYASLLLDNTLGGLYMAKAKFDGKDLDGAEVIEKLKKAYKGESSLEAQEFPETRLQEANTARLNELEKCKKCYIKGH